MEAQLSALPPGYADAYNGHKLAATSITCIVLIVVFVGARFASRYIHNTPRGWDDYLMVPALIFSLLLAAQGLTGIDYCGVGRHIAILAPSKVTALSKQLLFFPCTYAIAVTFPKLSVLAMYLRIFPIRFYRFVTYFLIYFIVVSSTILFMMMLFQCTPVNYFWDKTIPNGKCHFDVEKLFLYASLPNIITDAVILVLPLPFIWTLNITRKVKIGLMVTLFTGSIGLATSLLRFVQFAHQTLFPDVSWASVDLALYTILETSMYIIAACLPACRPLFNKIRQTVGLKKQVRPDSILVGEPYVRDIEMHHSGGLREKGGGVGSVKGSLGRFKRLGSDAGLGLAHIGNLVRKNTGSSGAGSGGGEQKELRRADSNEVIIMTPERAHMRETEWTGYPAGGELERRIHIKHEFDIYYDRAPL